MSTLGCRAYWKNGKACTYRVKEGEFCLRHQKYDGDELQEVHEVEVKSRSSSARKTSTKKRYSNEQIGLMLEAIINHFGIKVPELENKEVCPLPPITPPQEEEKIPTYTCGECKKEHRINRVKKVCEDGYICKSCLKDTSAPVFTVEKYICGVCKVGITFDEYASSGACVSCTAKMPTTFISDEFEDIEIDEEAVKAAILEDKLPLTCQRENCYNRVSKEDKDKGYKVCYLHMPRCRTPRCGAYITNEKLNSSGLCKLCTRDEKESLTPVRSGKTLVRTGKIPSMIDTKPAKEFNFAKLKTELVDF